MKKFLILAMLIFCFINANAQSVNSHWFSGASTFGIEFDSGNAPTQNNVKSSSFGHEGSAVATNNNGDLLFYTDGRTVFREDHTIMLNGTALGADPSCAQAAAICPKMDACNQYYIFSNGAPNNPSIFWSVVDMSDPAEPLGKVTDKNQLLISGVTEAMVIIPIDGTHDFWLLGKYRTSPDYFAFKIENGVITAPISSFGIGSINSAYTFTPNPTNDKIAVCGYFTSGIITVDFNDGVFSNPVVISNASAYDAEWSGIGTKLYFSYWRDFTLYQYDYNFPSTAPVSIYGPSSVGIRGGGLKRGPDDRIYYIIDRNGTDVGVIETPNGAGAACNFDPSEYNGGVAISGINFPEIIAVPSAPPTTDFTYTAINCYTYSFEQDGWGCSYDWDFGDTNPPGSLTNTSTDRNPTHTYSTNGTYTVTLTVNGSLIITNTITIGIPTTTLTASATVVCSDSPVILTATGGDIYNWSSNPPGTVGTGSSITVNPTTTTTYTVKITDSSTMCTEDKEIEIIAAPCDPCLTTRANFIYYIITMPPCAGCPTKVEFQDITVVPPGSVITNWSWDFGDGGTGNGQSTSHTFASGLNAYTVTLIITVDNGSTLCYSTKAFPIPSFFRFGANSAPISQNSADLKIDLFPNPIKDHATISINLPTHDIFEIKIYDIHGRIIYEHKSDILEKGEYLIPWDIEGINAGIYLMEIKTKNTIKHLKRILIE